jgi:hypothetical protein
MAGLATVGTRATLALGLLAACDSTSADSDRLLIVQGEVLEVGQAPSPSLDVDIQAWPALGSDGSDVAILRTDPGGRYRAELGPFPDPLVDSLRVTVTQNDCGLQLTTELRRQDLTLGEGEALVLPTLDLSYRLPAARLDGGQQMCGAIATRNTPEFVGGDYARLALWIDEVGDSVRGRWRLNHSASVGDDFGYFSGVRENDRVILQLRPTQPTPCTGLRLDMPLEDGATIAAGELTGDGGCSVPSTTLRLFEGAALSEVLPPITLP